MKVFMSWSGQRSKLTAELLYDWVKCVIQAAQPWISSRGIERGALWFSEINSELKDTSVGVICITQENKSAPWILFEAGAIAKGLDNHRVCTFLVDLGPADLQPPLAQFNHTFPTKDSMWSLVNTLNNSLEIGRLEPTVLERVFDTYWPQFERDFRLILDQNPQPQEVQPREEKDILAEILETTRSTAQRVRILEDQITPSPNRNKRVFISHTSGGGISRFTQQLEEMQFNEAVNRVAKWLKSGMAAGSAVPLLIAEGFASKAAQEILGAAILLGEASDSDSSGS